MPASIAELGYRELDRRGSELLFQILTEREEKDLVSIMPERASASSNGTVTPIAAMLFLLERSTPIVFTRQIQRDASDPENDGDATLLGQAS